MLIDTHAHLNFKEFGDEIPDVVNRAKLAGVGAIINVGSNFATSKVATRISHESGKNTNKNESIKAKKLKSYDLQPRIYAAVGCHPIHLVSDIVEEATFDGKIYKFKTKQETFDYDKYKKLARSTSSGQAPSSDKVVAVGETGLDYYHLDNNSKLQNSNDKLQINSNNTIFNNKKIQKEVFEKHIKLAEELNLPLILHCRGSEHNPYDVYDEMLEILNEWCHPEQQRRILSNRDSFPANKTGKNDMPIGVIHCFGGNLDQAKQFIKLGFYIGFTGIITFKNALEIQNIVKDCPLGKILIETDCPFLAPVPYRGKRNEPAYVVEVARKIAELKNITLEEVEKMTTQNAINLFKLSTN